jgi:hypothetical protein
MKTNVLFGRLKQLHHIGLGEPHRIVGELHLYFGAAVLRLVNQ